MKSAGDENASKQEFDSAGCGVPDQGKEVSCSFADPPLVGSGRNLERGSTNFDCIVYFTGN